MQEVQVKKKERKNNIMDKIKTLYNVNFDFFEHKICPKSNY